MFFKKYHLVRVGQSVVKLCVGFVSKFSTSESSSVLVTKLQQDVCKLRISGYVENSMSKENTTKQIRDMGNNSVIAFHNNFARTTY